MVTSTPGVIDCEGVCNDTFDYNDSVTLTAIPDAGSKFTSWSGDTDCDDGNVTMTTDVSCTANFYKFPWTMFLPAITGKTQP